MVIAEVRLELRAETEPGYQSVLRYLEETQGLGLESAFLTFKRQDGPRDWNTPHLHRNRERQEHVDIKTVLPPRSGRWLLLTCIGL